MRFWIFSLVLFIFFGSFFIYKNLNFLADSSVPPLPYIDLKKIEKPNIEKVVAKGLENSTGNYAFYIKNFKAGEEYFLNKDKQYGSGSLYKLWVMAVVFENIEKGTLKEEDVLSDTVANLNSKFGLEEGFLELPSDYKIDILVKDAIYQMITISHNYSALLLLDRFGSENIARFLKNNGFASSTIVDEPRTTAYDMGLFFEKLYKKDFVNSEKMLEILKDQKLNDGIPKYLPEDVKVAHKTGDLNWFKHDAGIVFADNGDYVFVGMSESNSPQGAQERIALISKAIYEYFTAN